VAFGSDNDLKITVTTDTSGAVTGLKNVDKGLEDVENQARQAGSVLDKFTTGLIQGIGQGAAQAAIRGLVSAFESLPDAIRRGAEVDDITSSFEKLSASAGVSGDALINKFSKALGDTIPKVDLMKDANELLVGGLDPSQFELVAKAARSFAEVTGGSAKDGIEALSSSLLKGNDRALKSLGIVVDNNKAYADFAATIGTTADKLSEEGKVMATRNAVLQALSENQSKLGDVTDDAADKLDQMSAALTNQKDQALRAISNNADLSKVLDQLKTVVEEIDFTSLVQEIAVFINYISGPALQGIRNFADNMSSLFLEIETRAEFRQLANENPFRWLTDSAGLLDEAQQKVAALNFQSKELTSTTYKLKQITEALTFAKTNEEVDKLKLQFIDTAKGAQTFGVSAESLKGNVSAFGAVADKARDSINKTGKSLSENTAALKVHGDYVDRNKSKQEAATKAEKEQQAAVKELTKNFEESRKAIKDRNDAIERSISSDGRYKDLLKQLADGTIKATEAQDKFEQIIKDSANAVELNQRASNSLATAIGAVANNTPLAGDALLEYAKAAQEAAKANGEFGESSKKISGGSFGFDSGSFGEQISNVLADALASAITKAFAGQTLKKEDFASIGGSIVGAAADYYAPGTGGIASAITQGIINSFGNDGAGTKAKKSIDKYFAELFDGDRLGIIVDGELVKISDLVFNGDTLFGGNVKIGDTGFSKYLQSLGPEAQAAFNGIGAGFAALSGQSEEYGAQIAAALANNVGDSLNNLQLLVEATGASFESLKDAVTNAFLNGNITAGEALSQLNAINQVATKGIPDGLGKVSEAFDNLKAAGEKGGRALVDALGDIGVEAKELKIKTLPDLANYLVATGKYTKDEVGKLMQALAAGGIKSVDQLASASTQQLLPALAKLSEVKFPFAEAASQSKQLTDEISKIPDKKSCVVEVTTKASKEDRELIKQVSNIQGRGPGLQAA